MQLQELLLRPNPASLQCFLVHCRCLSSAHWDMDRLAHMTKSHMQLCRCIPPVKPQDVVLGQYAAAGGKPGYLEDETVPKDSKTPTFATWCPQGNEREVGRVCSNCHGVTGMHLPPEVY